MVWVGHWVRARTRSCSDPDKAGVLLVIKTVSLIALALAGTSASAATITYTVNQTINLGNVSGTIQTNGTLGNLDQSDVIGFDLLVGGPGVSIELTQANSVIVTEGSNFSATAHDLSFNYSGPSGFLLFQFGSFGTGKKYYCNASVSGTCFQGASAIPDQFDSVSTQVEQRSGTQIIGSSIVPEPASWALMLGGFGLVGAALRRRSTATIVYA